jgi:hypothetical protein
MIKQKKMEPSKIRIWIVILCLIVVAAFALLIKFHYLFALEFGLESIFSRVIQSEAPMVSVHRFQFGNSSLQKSKHTELLKHNQILI